MTKARGNPFASDGAMSRAAWKDKTTNEAVRVTAHMRKRPVRAHLGPARGLGQNVEEKIVDNSFASGDFGPGPTHVSGLDGETHVNHLKAAVGLLNRKGSSRV